MGSGYELESLTKFADESWKIKTKHPRAGCPNNQNSFMKEIFLIFKTVELTDGKFLQHCPVDFKNTREEAYGILRDNVIPSLQRRYKTVKVRRFDQYALVAKVTDHQGTKALFTYSITSVTNRPFIEIH